MTLRVRVPSQQREKGAGTWYVRLFHAAVNINARHAASVLVYTRHAYRGLFVSQKHWLGEDRQCLLLSVMALVERLEY